MNKRGRSELENREVVVRKWNIGVNLSDVGLLWVTARSLWVSEVH